MLRIITKIFVYLFFILFITPTLLSQGKSYYFYHGLRYGSELCYNPITLIINGGFGIMQINNRSTQLRSIDFKIGARNIWKNISNPIEEIKTFGVKDFITSEIIPYKLRPKNAQWFPNYQLHLIGGGMTYRTLQDWYQYHNFKYPRLNAILALSVYHILNEVVENNSYQGNNVDVIADMLIFNPLGVLLFSFDSVAKFFSQTLHMADWSFQPMYSPLSGTLENNGQNFSIKYKLPYLNSWSLFYFFGVHGVLGLSYKTPTGSSFSLGGGLIAKDLIETKRKNNTRSMTTSLKWTAGFFYDRNNSLLASLILAGTKGYRLRLNIYPGLIPLGLFSPGLFCAVGKKGELITGINFSFTPIGCAGDLMR